MRSIQGFMGDAGDAPILNGAEISQSIASAPGVRSILLMNTSPTSLEGTISISNVGDFLAVTGTDTRLVTFSEGANSSSIIVNMDIETAPQLISMLSPEVEQYLSALMAPAALGEKYTKEEYLELLAMVYGRPLSNEIAAGRITAFIQFPRPVRSAQGGRANGRTAEFDIPLLDLLVLEHPLRYEVVW